MSYHLVNKVPYLVIDDFFDEDEVEDIWRTLDSFDPLKLMDPEESGTAHYATMMGSLRSKSNGGMFLKSLYDRELRHYVPIMEPLERLQRELKKYSNDHPALRPLQDIENEDILVSYYGQGDYYKKHFDTATITILIWLYKEPKSFEGGGLTLEDTDYIECKNNRVVVIPSYCFHEVDAVSMDPRLQKGGHGRWCISLFNIYHSNKHNLTSCSQSL